MSKDNGGPASDRELLEMAAKAAGIVGVWHDRGQCIHVTDCAGMSDFWWRPLDDDGDALRLAVKLRMDLNINDGECDVFTADSFYNGRGEDTLETTRRAIVRAAAAIGSAM